MGMLYRRGKTWWLKWYDNGRCYRQTARTSDHAEAKRQLAKREAAVAEGRPIAPQLSRLIIEDAARDLEADYIVKGRRSLKDVQRRLKLHLFPYFKGRRLVSIEDKNIRAYAAQRLEAGAKPATVNRELAILGRLFKLSGLPVPRIGKLPEDNVRQGFVTADQLAAIVAKLPEALRPVVTFAFLTGWRVPSEVLPLQWSAVDFAAGTVTLGAGTTKNRAPRVRYFTDDDPLGVLLRAQQVEQRRLRAEGRIVPWVFHRHGKGISSFRTAWQTACTEAGVPGRLVHDLRRSAVRNFVRAGISDPVAMKMSGHLTRSVFDRYNIVSEADQREAAQKLADYLTGTISGTGASQAAGGGARK